MNRPLLLALAFAFAAALAAPPADAAARSKRPAGDGGEAGFWGGLVPMENGVPIIMKGYHPPKAPAEPATRGRRSERPVRIPRGSSSFQDIPPVNPSPSAGPTPQEIIRQGQAVQPYSPPPIRSFGDRVIDAIHAYPLEKGLGNNPVDQQMFIRQRANQP